jgi:hypothetical protein
LNGYASYWPTGFPQRLALACRLPDPEALAALRRETGLAMILVHLNALGDPRPARPPYKCPPCVWVGPPDPLTPVGSEERALWLALADHGGAGLQLVARDGDDLLFAVTQPSAEPPPRAR